jgi:hypothetical protein
MLRSASRILGYRLTADDGEVGRCVDFLLEPPAWSVRYVLVDTDPRFEQQLGKRSVGVSPLRLRKSDWTSRRWVLDGTRQQLDMQPERAPGLQSLKQLLGFGLDDVEGNVGHIEDLIVDDDTWCCRYLVINGEIRLYGRKTLVPMEWLGELHVDEHRIEARVPRALIHGQPEYRPEAPVYHLHGTDPGALPSDESSVPPSWRHNPPLAWASALHWGTRGLRAALAPIARERQRRI